MDDFDEPTLETNVRRHIQQALVIFPISSIWLYFIDYSDHISEDSLQFYYPVTSEHYPLLSNN